MRNRAKCKLCNTIIESYANVDYIECKCGEIAISGGHHKLQCFANDFANFMRVDENGNEIIVKYEEEKGIREDEFPANRPTKNELIEMLDEMRKRIETLPQEAMLSPVTHSDFASLLLLLSAILREDCSAIN